MTGRTEPIGSTLAVAYMTAGVGQLVNQAYVFLIFQYLPLEDVGIFSWAVAIATIYTYAMDFGLPTFLMGELSERRYTIRSVIQVIIASRLPVLVIGGGAFAVYTLTREPTANETAAVGLITLSYTLQLIDGGLAPWFQVRKQQNSLNRIGLVLPVARLTGLGIPAVMGREIDLVEVALLMVMAQVISTATYLLVATRHERLGASPKDWADARVMLGHFRTRGPRLGAMYAVMVLQARLDWLMISVVLSNVALANYSLANRVLEFGMLLAAVLARTSFPWHSRVDRGLSPLGSQLAMMQRLFVWFSASVGVVLFFCVPPLVAVVFDDKYVGAATAIRLMALVSPVFMLNQYLFYLFLVQRQEQNFTVLVLGTTAVQVGLNLLLLPRIGILGAAVAMSVMGILLHGGQLVLLVRHGYLRLAEAIRFDVFVFVSTGVLGFLWLADVGPLIGTGVASAAVAVLAILLLLETDDGPILREYARSMAGRSMARLSGSGAKP